MAASDWLFDNTIAGLKRRANIPTSAESWTAADFRAYANDSMNGYILPLLRRLSEEFFVTLFDTALVNGTASYKASYRILGEALRDVQLSDGAGGYISLVRREPADLGPAVAQAVGFPGVYYLQDDSIVLVPTPGTGTLRVKAMVRPNKLVATSGVYKVTVVGASTLTVTPLDTSVSATAETTLGSTATLDVVQAKPGFRHIGIDLSATISSNTVTCTTTGVAVGDYVCTSEESPVAQIPAELHPLLAQDVACAVLRASSAPGYAEAVTERDRLESIARGLFSPRTENQPRYIINRYGMGGTAYIRRRWVR